MLAKYNKWHVPSYGDDYFNDIVSRKYYGFGQSATPAVNIREENTEFCIDVAAIGLAKDDIKINVEDDILTISSEKKESGKDKVEHFTRREFNYESFSRRFQLPETVNQEEIKAEHANGVLSIHLPKKEESVKPGPRTIEIA